MSNIYTLPEWRFIGGETQEREFSFLRESGSEFNLPDATCSFAIADFVNSGSPLLRKAVNVTESDLSNYNVATVVLEPSDTVNLHGKYEYQISVKAGTGEISIPSKGLMYIANNIDKDFV